MKNDVKITLGQFGGDPSIPNGKKYKIITFVNDYSDNFSYMVTKGSNKSIQENYYAHRLLMGIGLEKFLPKIYSYTESNGEYTFIIE
jgi:ribosomal protein L19